MNSQSHSHTAISDAPGSLQSIKAAMAFLQQYSPYDEVPENLLEKLLTRSSLAFYPEGAAVFSPDDGVPDHFCIVQQGLISGRREQADEEALLFEAGPGESFLNVALLEQRPTYSWHRAEHDSFVIEIPRQAFELLLEKSPAFADFCQRRASTLIDSARQRIRAQASTALQTDLSLDTPLSDLIQRPALSCSPDTAIQKAVEYMHQAEVSSIVIVDGDAVPIGIFTLRDLRSMIAEGKRDLDLSIDNLMTPAPMSLQTSQPAYEAAMLMVQRHIGHIPLLDQGALAGVISERDLFALKKVNLVQLARNIEKAASAGELREVRASIIVLIRTMLAAGASARQLTGIITRLNDAIVQRVIELCRAAHTEPVPDFCWLSFGSEARGEQTLATDQDNGILFEANEAEADSLRQQLLPLALAINDMLDQVGFPLCRGNIMASNPALCLSADEWREKYRGIIKTSTPEHLLHATIFLDFRALYGDDGAVKILREEILEHSQGNSIFLHALAQDALSNRPPLGTFRSFITHKSEEGKALDLKKSGLQPLIAAVRVLALANKVLATNTEDRLDALEKLDIIQPRNAAAWKEAFAFIQLLRMRRNEDQLEAGKSLSNDINPYQLNPLDKRILKEALRQAARLQTRLKLDYA